MYAIIYFFLLLCSCECKVLSSKAPGELRAGYSEIFFEDFDTFNASTWNIEVGNGQGVDGNCNADQGCPNLPGYGNGEIQQYSPNNILVSHSHLVLFSSFNESSGVWNSGRINSMGKFSFTYGLIEARLKISQIVKGIFPAFWLLPEHLLHGYGWPYNGEMDVFEFLSDWNSTVDGAVQYHTPSTFHFGAHFAKNGLSFREPPNQSVDDYHVYAIDWQPEKMIILRDNHIIGIYEKPMLATEYDWPFDYPFHLICNMAIYPREGSPPDSTSERQFLAIDWIRISQRKY